MPKHIHAELMMLYSQDAMETDKPWERWEVQDSTLKWSDVNSHPGWCTSFQYRRKPKTININGYLIPEPLRVAPEVGTTYYVSAIDEKDIHSCEWDDDESDFYWLSLGLIHLAKEAAQLHQKALLSFTTAKD